MSKCNTESDSLFPKDSEEHFKKINATNWCKSELITSGKFFELAHCDSNFKLSFICKLCLKKPGVFISADISSCGNLKKHISVSLIFYYCRPTFQFT